MTEGADIARALAELHALGVEHATFDSKFAVVHQAIHDGVAASDATITSGGVREPRQSRW